MPFEDCTAALVRRDVLAGAVCTAVILACIYDFQDYHHQQMVMAPKSKVRVQHLSWWYI